MRELVERVPEVDVARSGALERAIDASVAYLGSEGAAASLAVDPYWPKWDSPWWHMCALWELGEATRIPPAIVAVMVERMQAFPLKLFPITAAELGNADPYRDVMCHCALGTLWQVLAACGVDLDRALPWMRPWFARYQMADGGMSCDDTAYQVTDECPSSMVGTIAPFEAMLDADPHGVFTTRAATFLIERQLRLGSPTRHNADERASAEAWPLLCSPRFYFYDVLRGLTALVTWAEHTGGTIPAVAIEIVVKQLVAAFPDGVVRTGRDAAAGRPTLWFDGARLLPGRREATRFALLDEASRVGEPSCALSGEWAATRAALLRLIDAGRVTP